MFLPSDKPCLLIDKQGLLLILCLILLCTLFSANSVAESVQQPTIAIVIDDMGNNLKNGKQLVDLPYPLTFAFLPDRKHTLSLIKQAKKNNKEIMLHSPMENHMGIRLGRGGLRTDMSEMQIKQTLRKSFIAVPNMVGLNNHMGSTLTENPKFMRWVMETVRQHPFFFLDSRTSPNSVAAKVASRYQIPTLKRDVFLDHFQNRKFVQRQFNKLIEIAKKKGTAIAIGHPHQVTTEYISWALTKLDEKGVRIATASAIWQIQNPNQTMNQIFTKRSLQNQTPRLSSTLPPSQKIKSESEPQKTLTIATNSIKKLASHL